MPVRLLTEAQPTAVKQDKKGFCRYINSKRKTRKNVPMNGAENLATNDIEKAELNDTFTPFFTDKIGLHES